MVKLRFIRWVIPILCIGFLAGCASTESHSDLGPPIRVGITPDYAPLIYQQGDGIVGLEADLARQLGADLGRPIQFVKVRWENQLSELIAGNTDIVISGMSVTPARELRAAFAEPYLRSGLMTLVRSTDAGDYTSVEEILATRKQVGVQRGSTAAAFVRENMPNARVIELAGPDVAPYELRRKRIAMYVDDGHSVAWLASENEGKLTGIFLPLTEEKIGWAVRRTDPEFLAEVNGILHRWRRNGVLKATISQWMPYAERVAVLGEVPPASETP